MSNGEIEKKLKILALTNEYPSKYQTWFINYLKAIKLINHSVTVWCSSTDESVEDLNERWLYQLVTPKNELRKFVRALPRLVFRKNFYGYVKFLERLDLPYKEKLKRLTLAHNLLLEMDYDLVHIHCEKLAYRYLPLLNFLDIPTVITFHGLQPKGIPDLSHVKRTFIYTHVASVLVNTQFARKQIESILDRKVNAKIIPQGIDVSEFPFREKEFNSSEIRVLTVGRLDYFKGIQYVIPAIKKLRESGVEVFYNIAGQGLYKQDLKNLITRLDASGYVDLLGTVTGGSLKRLYFDSDIFILPSIDDGLGEWVETQGIVIQEAQATGLITVGTNSGGIPECIPSDSGAMLIKQKSSEDVVEALSSIIQQRDLRSSMTVSGRDWVLRNFSISTMSCNLNSAYMEICGK